MNKFKNNLIALGAMALFFAGAHVSYAAYVCEPFAIEGTSHFVNSCYNINSPARYNTSSYYTYNTQPDYGTYATDSLYNNGYDNNFVTNTNTSNGVNDNSNYLPNNQVATATTTNTTTNNTTNNTTTKKVATTTTKSTSDDVTTTNVSNTQNETGRYENVGNNGLTALSLQGSNSFMPDTLWEWICVFFLMLIIVILIRQFRPKHATKVQHVAHH